MSYRWTIITILLWKQDKRNQTTRAFYWRTMDSRPLAEAWRKPVLFASKPQQMLSFDFCEIFQGLTCPECTGFWPMPWNYNHTLWMLCFCVFVIFRAFTSLSAGRICRYYRAIHTIVTQNSYHKYFEFYGENQWHTTHLYPVVVFNNFQTTFYTYLRTFCYSGIVWNTPSILSY